MSGVSLAQPDITLHLDDEGVIREASVSGSIPGELVQSWVGRSWLDTVSSGTEKGRRMLDDARRSGVAGLRDVVQRFPSGQELPVEYTVLRVPGERGGLLALGRNLQAVTELQSRLIAAQQATEREYWKLRDVETRYRLLFDASNEAALMIGGADLRIIEANDAAERALGLGLGTEFTGQLAPKERDGFISMLELVRQQGRAPGIVLHLGHARAPWAVRASLMAATPELRYLMHLAPAGARVVQSPLPGVVQSPAEHLPLDDLLERLPDGFAVLDPEGTILRANQAFLNLVAAGTIGLVRGETLGRWLSQPGADASVLLANVERHGTVRQFQAVLDGEFGVETPVEISAAMTGSGTLRVCGVLFRDVSRRAADIVRGPHHAAPVVPDAVPGEMESGSLLQVVRAVTEAVERRMIRGALDRAGDNRTSAAELLGISRQSLHTKLNRYGFADESGSSAESG